MGGRTGPQGLIFFRRTVLSTEPLNTKKGTKEQIETRKTPLKAHQLAGFFEFLIRRTPPTLASGLASRGNSILSVRLERESSAQGKALKSLVVTVVASVDMRRSLAALAVALLSLLSVCDAREREFFSNEDR